MKNLPFILVSASLAFVSASLPAAEPPPQFVEVPPPPPVNIDTTDPESSDAELEPDVTIIDREDGTHEEYRVNGKLYMVKVTPSVGPPYYYVDRDGDGLMETTLTGRTAQPHVPQWVIFSW